MSSHPVNDEPAPVWLTPAAVAKRLGVSAKTVQRLANAGHLHPNRLPSGHRRYKAAEVDALAGATR